MSWRDGDSDRKKGIGDNKIDRIRDAGGEGRTEIGEVERKENTIMIVLRKAVPGQQAVMLLAQDKCGTVVVEKGLVGRGGGSGCEQQAIGNAE